MIVRKTNSSVGSRHREGAGSSTGPAPKSHLVIPHNRSVVIEAKCDTDALPSTAGAVHKLAVVTADSSPGGKTITDNEALECEPEIDAAMEALASLKARCIAIRKARAA